MDMPFSALFFAAADCGRRQGITGKAFHRYDGPDGVKVKLNSTDAEAESIPAIHMGIFDGDWPLAVLNPYGGEFVRNGKWTEDTLIAAFDAHCTQDDAPPNGRGRG